MSRKIDVICSSCKDVFVRSFKQVNQVIKKRGSWRCSPCASASQRVDLHGMIFNRLKVLERSENIVYKGGEQKTAWLCECDCGARKTISGNQLLSGKSQSCGCYALEEIIKRTTTHGRTSTREYRIWQAMRTRCGNENVPNYKNYGARGISICDRWGKFENFYEDMGDCPKNFSIERLDMNGDYEPSNCVWADRITQARNNRRNRRISFMGETLCLIEWANRIGIDQASLRERLDKWTLERALTEPKRNNL